jgi:hypothetical protein
MGTKHCQKGLQSNMPHVWRHGGFAHAGSIVLITNIKRDT